MHDPLHIRFDSSLQASPSPTSTYFTSTFHNLESWWALSNLINTPLITSNKRTHLSTLNNLLNNFNTINLWPYYIAPIITRILEEGTNDLIEDIDHKFNHTLHKKMAINQLIMPFFYHFNTLFFWFLIGSSCFVCSQLFSLKIWD